MFITAHCSHRIKTYVRTYVRYICHCNHASIATACHTPHWPPSNQHQHTPSQYTVHTATSIRTPTLEASTVTGTKQPPSSLHPTTDSVMLDTALAGCFLEPLGASTFLARCMCICTYVLATIARSYHNPPPIECLQL